MRPMRVSTERATEAGIPASRPRMWEGTTTRVLGGEAIARAKVDAHASRCESGSTSRIGRENENENGMLSWSASVRVPG
jgi:hypothetical protein